MQDNARGEKLEAVFIAARSGDREAFARWAGMMELPLRRALGRFARHVDVEVVVQETFLRMWILANDLSRVLEGENASARFAFTVARNVAFEQLRKSRTGQFVNIDDIDPPDLGLEPLSDPALDKKIRACIEELPKQPRDALNARAEEGHIPDKQLAEKLRMKLNTFLQNVVRARKLVRQCLERSGIRLEEVLR
jgi:RNA polymerase sigma factor (sigma-70 family)